MPTASGHTRAILASKVKGTPVYNPEGEKIGHVEDVVLDKLSNNIEFAVLGFGGLLGMGEKFHPVPWSMLNYDERAGGYVVDLDKDDVKEAPAYELEDLTKNDGDIRAQSFKFYQEQPYW